jgi:hypothetical protein
MTKTLLKTTMVALLALASSAVAAPPGPRGEGWRGRDGARPAHAGQRMRMMYVVAIADALELTEAEALKMSERIKAIEDRRQPLRQEMWDAMRAVKAAAEGDAAALAQVDANVQKVLDGRAQVAAMDREMFQLLSKDLSPQKKAKLALVLARLTHARGGGRANAFGPQDE